MAEDDKNIIELGKIIDKSEDDFENKLTYITAGALGLSFAFIEKIVNIESSIYKWILISGWSFLSITLLINLVSHLLSKRVAYNLMNDLEILDKDDLDKVNDFNNKVLFKNSITEKINYFTVGFLIMGILSIVLFSAINILKDEKDTKRSNSHQIEVFRNNDNINVKYYDFSLQINDTNLIIKKNGQNTKKNILK